MVPEEFLCRLTKTVMREPMVNRYGVHFERSAIMEWFEQGNTHCPVTNNRTCDVKHGFLTIRRSGIVPLFFSSDDTNITHFGCACLFIRDCCPPHTALRVSNVVSDKNLQWKIQYWAKKNGRDDLLLEESSAAMENDENVAGRIQATVSVPPNHLVCRITKDIMDDPVMTKYGDSYERKAILRKLEVDGDSDPFSGKELRVSDLVTNHKLLFEINQWKMHYGQAYDEVIQLEVESKVVKATMVSQGYQTMDILKALVIESNINHNFTNVPMEDDDLHKKIHATPLDVIDVLDEIDDIVS
jgi:hypothetical protein